MDLAIGGNGQARWVDSQLYINGAGVDERLYVGRGAERSAAEDKPTSSAGSGIVRLNLAQAILRSTSIR